jgi:hypothetical protein
MLMTNNYINVSVDFCCNVTRLKEARWFVLKKEKRIISQKEAYSEYTVFYLIQCIGTGTGECWQSADKIFPVDSSSMSW